MLSCTFIAERVRTHANDEGMRGVLLPVREELECCGGCEVWLLLRGYEIGCHSVHYTLCVAGFLHYEKMKLFLVSGCTD